MLQPIPENGITLHTYVADEHTVAIANFVVHGQHGIGIGRKVFEEWQSAIPEQYDVITLRAKNDDALRFWCKMGFVQEGHANVDGEYWMRKDISAIPRDARIPFLFTTSVQEIEAAHKTAQLGMSPEAFARSERLIDSLSKELAETGGCLNDIATVPDDEILAAAVRKWPEVGRFIRGDLAEHLQFLVVNIDGMAIWSLDNPSDAVKVAAIKNSPSALMHMDLSAKNGFLLQYLALTHGLPKGHFRANLLTEHSALFTDAVLDTVRPGLSVVRALMDGMADEARAQTYATLSVCAGSEGPNQTLPMDVGMSGF